MATLDKGKLSKENTKRARFICIATVIEALLSIIVSSVIHQICTILFVMQKIDLKHIDFSILNALSLLRQEGMARFWYIMLQGLYICYLLYILCKPKAEISEVKEITVTDRISIPIAIGNGQYGNARFASKKEMDTMFEMFINDGNNKPPSKGGVVVEMKQVGNKEYIRYIKGDKHCLILGATGAGKTRRILLETTWLQILSGLSIVVSDVKGEIFYYTSSFAKQFQYNIVPIDLRYPNKSMHYNFLSPILQALKTGDLAKAIDYTWDLVSVLVGEQKGEPLWYNGETATIAAAILAVCMEAEEQFRNLTNVYYFLAYMCSPHPRTGKTPLSLYLATLDDNHPAKTVFAMAQVAAERTKSSFYTSAMGTLRLFTNPNIAEMTSKSDFNIENIGLEKTIVYMIIPDEKKTFYPLASIFVQQLYISQIEVANAHGLKLPVETDYNLDEIGNFPTIPVLGNMLSAGRSRGIRVNMVVQDYQQLQSKYEKDIETLKTCCQAKIYLKSDNTKTLEEISKTLGKYTVETTSASTSASTNQKGNDANISTSSNMTGRELLMPSEISMIDYPHALCMMTGYSPCIMTLPDLSKYKINHLWGLGDEQHNNMLMQKKEDERPVRKVGQIPLWGIWSGYKELLEKDAEEQMDIFNRF